MKLGSIKDQKGAALISVIIIICILIMTIVTAAITLTDAVRTQNKVESNSESAFNIAESGVGLYLRALSLYPDKYKFPEKMGVLEPEILYTESKWINYPKKYKTYDVKESGKNVGQFNITVVPPDLPTKKTLTIYSEGWLNDKPNVKKTIKVELINKGTDGSTPAPNNVGPNNKFVIVANTACETDGTPIYIDQFSVFNDPVLFDDDLYFDGRTEFLSSLYTSGKIINATPPAFQAPDPTPFFGAETPISISGTKIIQHQDIDKTFELMAIAANPSLTFTGRTRIKFDGSSMYVCNAGLMGDQPNNLYLDGLCKKTLSSTTKIYVLGDVWLTGKVQGDVTVFATGNVYISGVDITQNFQYEYELASGVSTYNLTKTNGITYNNPESDILFIYSYKNVLIHTTNFPKPGGSGTSGNTFNISGKYFVTNNMDVYANIYAPNGAFKLQGFPEIAQTNTGELKTDGVLNFVGSAAVYFFSTFNWHDGYYGKGQVLGYKFIGTFDSRVANYTLPYTVNFDTEGSAAIPYWSVSQWNVQ